MNANQKFQLALEQGKSKSGSISDNLATLVIESSVGGKVSYDDWRLRAGQNLDIPEAFSKLITEMGDKNPMYVTYALPSGFSYTLNEKAHEDRPINRYWSEEIFQELGNQINILGEAGSGLPGYKGHPTSQADLLSLPEPSVLWISAGSADNVNTGNHAELIKGYVYEVGSNRALHKTRAFNAGSVNAVAKAELSFSEEHNAFYEDVKSANFLSVDLVRPGTEGIQNTSQIALEGVNMKLTPEQIALAIAGINLQDLKQHNPGLIAQLTSESGTGGKVLSPDMLGIFEKLNMANVEAIENRQEAKIATEAAKMLGCDVFQLPAKIQSFVDANKTAITIATEASINSITHEGMKAFVVDEFKSKELKNVEEVKIASESAIARYKKYIGDASKELGAITDNILIFESSAKDKDADAFDIGSDDINALVK